MPQKATGLFITLAFILIASPLILISVEPTQAQTTPEVGWLHERGHVEYLGNNTYRTRSWIAPQVFWNNATGNWTSLYLLDRTGAANPHYVVRNAHVSARVGISTEWEQEGVLYYDPNFTKPRAAEFWTPQAYIGGTWESLDTTFFSHELEYIPDQKINITGIFRVWRAANHVGWLRISYILTPAAFLKHEVVFRNIAAQTTEVRMVMTLMGIAGKRIVHKLGDDIITFTAKQIEGYWFNIVNSSNPYFIFLSEKLDALGHWVMNETTGVEYWVNDYLRGVRAQLAEYKGKNLTRLDIAIGNYTLATDEEAYIDPDTSTWEVSSDLDDRNVYEGSSDHPPWGTMQAAGANALRAGRWSSELWGGFMRFDGITIPDTATISSAYFGKYCYDARTGASDTTIWLVEEDDPAAPTTITAYNDLDRSENTTTWIYDWTVDGQWETSPDLVDEFQEIIDMATWDSGDAVIILHEDEDGSSTSTDDLANQYFRDTALTANLTVTWTVPTGDWSFEFSESISVNGEVESWRALYRGFSESGTMTDIPIALRALLREISESGEVTDAHVTLRAKQFGFGETATIVYEFWRAGAIRVTVTQTIISLDSDYIWRAKLFTFEEIIAASDELQSHRALLMQFSEIMDIEWLLQTTSELQFLFYQTITETTSGVSSSQEWKAVRFTVIETPTILDGFSSLGAWWVQSVENIQVDDSSNYWRALWARPSETIIVTDSFSALGEWIIGFMEFFETASVSSRVEFIGLPEIIAVILPLLEVVLLFCGSWFFSLVYWKKRTYGHGFLSSIFWITTGGLWLLINPVGISVSLAFMGVGVFILITAMLTLLFRLGLRKQGEDEGEDFA